VVNRRRAGNAPFAMLSKIVWIIKKLINHETNLVRVCSFVVWQLFLSETFMEDIPVRSPFVTVRNETRDVVNAEP
jgi:hypothetical protein